MNSLISAKEQLKQYSASGPLKVPGSIIIRVHVKSDRYSDSEQLHKAKKNICLFLICCHLNQWVGGKFILFFILFFCHFNQSEVRMSCLVRMHVLSVH